MPPDPRVVRETLVLAARLEHEWMRKIPETDHCRTPWMPFPIPAYVSMLAEALPEVPGDEFRFLGVGSGIGTKEMLARELCGLKVTGLEIEPEYAAQAEALGVPTLVCDAADFGNYGGYDLIWFNRVYRDPDLQAALEKRIWDDMAPGAVVMCANLEYQPPPASFWPVLDDLEVRRAIYYKIPAP